MNVEENEWKWIYFCKKQTIYDIETNKEEKTIIIMIIKEMTASH